MRGEPLEERRGAAFGTISPESGRLHSPRHRVERAQRGKWPDPWYKVTVFQTNTAGTGEVRSERARKATLLLDLEVHCLIYRSKLSGWLYTLADRSGGRGRAGALLDPTPSDARAQQRPSLAMCGDSLSSIGVPRGLPQAHRPRAGGSGDALPTAVPPASSLRRAA